jgi:hypothetical protein
VSTVLNAFRLPTLWTSAIFVFLLFLGSSFLRADQVIYDDALENGWQDWGWTIINYSTAAPAPVHSGTYSIAVDMVNAFDGIRIDHNSVFDSSPYASLSFWINGDTQGGQQLWLRGVASGNFLPPITLSSPTAETWTQMTIPLSALGVANLADFEGIVFQNRTSSPQPIFLLDDIQLVSIPEPSSIVIFGLGLFSGLKLLRRRQGCN